MLSYIVVLELAILDQTKELLDEGLPFEQSKTLLGSKQFIRILVIWKFTFLMGKLERKNDNISNK